jgi:hypothetical protein
MNSNSLIFKMVIITRIPVRINKESYVLECTQYTRHIVEAAQKYEFESELFPDSSGISPGPVIPCELTIYSGCLVTGLAGMESPLCLELEY